MLYANLLRVSQNELGLEGIHMFLVFKFIQLPKYVVICIVIVRTLLLLL